MATQSDPPEEFTALYRLRVRDSPHPPSPARELRLLARPSWSDLYSELSVLHSHECPRGNEIGDPCRAQHAAFDQTSSASWDVNNAYDVHHDFRKCEIYVVRNNQALQFTAEGVLGDGLRPPPSICIYVEAVKCRTKTCFNRKRVARRGQDGCRFKADCTGERRFHWPTNAPAPTGHGPRTIQDQAEVATRRAATMKDDEVTTQTWTNMQLDGILRGLAPDMYYQPQGQVMPPFNIMVMFVENPAAGIVAAVQQAHLWPAPPGTRWSAHEGSLMLTLINFDNREAHHREAVRNAMETLSHQFPGELLLLALGGQEVRQWVGGALCATPSGVAEGRQPAVRELFVMDLHVSLPEHERTVVVRGKQLGDPGGEAPLVLYCLIDGCSPAEQLQQLHSTPDGLCAAFAAPRWLPVAGHVTLRLRRGAAFAPDVIIDANALRNPTNPQLPPPPLTMPPPPPPQGGPGGGQDGDDSDQEDDDEDYPPPMPPADWGAHPAPGWLPAHVAGGAGGMQLALPQRFALGEAEQRPSFNRQEAEAALRELPDALNLNTEWVDPQGTVSALITDLIWSPNPDAMEQVGHPTDWQAIAQDVEQQAGVPPGCNLQYHIACIMFHLKGFHGTQASHRAFMRRALLLLAKRFPAAGFTLHLGGRQLLEVRDGAVQPARAALTLAAVPLVTSAAARDLPGVGRVVVVHGTNLGGSGSGGGEPGVLYCLFPDSDRAEKLEHVNTHPNGQLAVYKAPTGKLPPGGTVSLRLRRGCAFAPDVHIDADSLQQQLGAPPAGYPTAQQPGQDTGLEHQMAGLMSPSKRELPSEAKGVRALAALKGLGFSGDSARLAHAGHRAVSGAEPQSTEPAGQSQAALKAGSEEESDRLLYVAAKHGNLQKVLELVRSRPPGKQGPHSGVTPLMAAAQGGHLAVLAALLAAGADPAAAGDPGKAGDSGANTALHLAAYHGQASVVGIMLQLTSGSTHGEVPTAVPMLAAAAAGHSDVVAVLLAAGCPADASIGGPESPLLLAAQGGHDSAVALLLAARSSQFSKPAGAISGSGAGGGPSKGDGGREEVVHALMLAAQAGAAGVVEQLLAAGAQTRDTWGDDGITALHAAACAPEGDAMLATQVALLRRSSSSRLQAQLGGSRATPLHIAAQRGAWSQVLADKADLNAHLADGTTPLMLACAAGHGAWVGRLLQGTTALARTPSGGTPSRRTSLTSRRTGSGSLHGGGPLATIPSGGTLGSAPSGGSLASQGSTGSGRQVEVDAADQRGHTALHHAAHAGCEAAVKALLEHGADSAAVAVDGATAMDLAQAEGHGSLVRLLRGRHRSVAEHVRGVAAKIRSPQEGEEGTFVTPTMQPPLLCILRLDPPPPPQHQVD